jgi:hypothetical protein
MAIFDTQRVPDMTDEELRTELSTCEPGSRVYIIVSDELTRRHLRSAGEAARQLSASSGRVEKLTWLLVALTIILIVLAAPPAWDAIRKLTER